MGVLIENIYIYFLFYFFIFFIFSGAIFVFFRTNILAYGKLLYVYMYEYLKYVVLQLLAYYNWLLDPPRNQIQLMFPSTV